VHFQQDPNESLRDYLLRFEALHAKAMALKVFDDQQVLLSYLLRQGISDQLARTVINSMGPNLPLADLIQAVKGLCLNVTSASYLASGHTSGSSVSGLGRGRGGRARGRGGGRGRGRGRWTSQRESDRDPQRRHSSSKGPVQ